MPNDLTLKAMNTVHRIILGISGGRMGWDVGNMPVLELTTTGRKSGMPRSVMLTSPIQEGESIVIVASRGGDDVHPAWYLNLVANPQVQVKYKGKPTVAIKKYEWYLAIGSLLVTGVSLVLLDRPRNP